MSVAATEKENKAWVNGVAGGLGSAMSKTLMSPIQRLGVLRQLGHKGHISELVHKVIDEERMAGVQEGGAKPRLQAQHFKGFFRGNLTSILQRFPYSGIQLMVYDRLKFAIAESLGVEKGDVSSTKAVASKAMASACAGAISGSATYPLEVIRSRLMSGDKRCRGFFSTISVVNEEKGIPGFYKGLSASLVQRVPDIVINLTVYESVKFSLGKQGYSDKVCVFAGGSAAALTAIAITFPLDVIKRRVAVGKSGMHSYNSPLHCATEVLKHEGPAAFYRGATLEAARCVPQVVLMWAAIEYFRSLLNSL